MLHLDPRLQTAADLLGRRRVFFDIGANHGRLGLYMVQAGLCQRAVLTDRSPDALRRAQWLAHETGLEASVTFRVCDGLRGLSIAPEDGMAICGMGARSILRILEGGVPCAAVLQANTELQSLRDAFPITQEHSVVAANRHYTLFLVDPTRVE